MNNDYKGHISLFEVFKALTNTKVAPEDKDLVKRLTESSIKTTQIGLGGYRVDAPITDWDEVEKELDKARFIVENKSNIRNKDEIYRQALLVLLKSVEIKTTKIDKLIEELEDMKNEQT